MSEKNTSIPTHKICLSAHELMSKANKMTGVHDIFDEGIETPLEKFLVGLNTEAQLNAMGAQAMEKRILRILCNRLWMLRDFKQHPEIDDQQIVKPLILTGSGRTGSTKLHKMLAASGDFIFLPFWQGHNLSLRSGNRKENSQQRIQDAEADIQWFNKHAPNAKLTHAFEAMEPEEELIILEHAMFGLYMIAFVYVPGFTEWSSQFFHEQMTFVKQGLKYLQWQFHDGDTRPWVLKAPIYFGLEQEVLKIFPDAVFAATHRHPVKSIPSTISLVKYYHQAYSDAANSAAMSQILSQGFKQGASSYLSRIDNDAKPDCLNIGYQSITQSPMVAIEKLYAQMDMNLTDKAHQAIVSWEKNNTQHKLGVHKYSLEDFSLSEDLIISQNYDYIQRFKHLF